MEDVSSGGLDVTPYGTFHDGLSYETLNSAHAVEYKSRFFQPVTHGQAQITQFNIVDRFGQVIYAHDPRPEQPKEPLYPHILDLLCFVSWIVTRYPIRHSRHQRATVKRTVANGFSLAHGSTKMLVSMLNF